MHEKSAWEEEGKTGFCILAEHGLRSGAERAERFQSLEGVCARQVGLRSGEKSDDSYLHVLKRGRLRGRFSTCFPPQATPRRHPVL